MKSAKYKAGDRIRVVLHGVKRTGTIVEGFWDEGKSFRYTVHLARFNQMWVFPETRLDVLRPQTWSI